MNNRKLIIIPDVHGRSFWRDAVKRNPGEEFIFLGDYLDPYPDEGYTDEEAFKGLEDIISFKRENPDRVTLLWGNHDLHYLYPEMMGSRFDIDNAIRNAHKFWDNQDLFKMAYEVQAGGKRFLFSHAGIGRGWIAANFPRLEDEDITAELLNDLVGYPEFMTALEDVSIYRKGNKKYGSMIWADPRELLKEENRLKGVVQVFGHTQMDRPFNYEDFLYCLDCRQSFYLNMDDGDIYYLRYDDRVTKSIWPALTRNNCHMSSWICETPFFQELERGIENYHKGIPISERIEVKELEVFVPRYRKNVADLVSPYGEEMIDSQVEIEGSDGECPIYNPEHIRGFFPEEEHEYLIKVRRYKNKIINRFYKYEFIEIIQDK